MIPKINITDSTKIPAKEEM